VAEESKICKRKLAFSLSLAELKTQITLRSSFISRSSFCWLKMSQIKRRYCSLMDTTFFSSS